MAKRATKIPNFQEKQTLKSIRENSLNPVIDQLFAVETNIETVIVPTMGKAYDKVTFDAVASKLSFVNIGGATTDIDLSSIVPPFAGIEVEGYVKTAGMPAGGDVKNASKIKFADATITKEGTDLTAQVVYDWSKIVPAFQETNTVTVLDTVPDPKTYNKIAVIGEGGKAYFSHELTRINQGTLKINMPIIPSQMIADVVKSPTEIVTANINKITLTGTVGGSTIKGDELQIDLNSGGAGRFAIGYFKGFFSSIDEIPTEDLHPDRSSAYIKSTVQGATIYTLYMYKGPSEGWKPILNNVPLILNDTQKQAVFSIKKNKDVTVDANGELNLDKLMNADESGYIGIFESVDALENSGLAVKDKSMALVRDDNVGAFLPYTYRIGNDSAQPVGWVITPVEGSLKFVDTNVTTVPYKPIIGVNAGPGISLGTDGMITLTAPKKGNILVKAKDSEEHQEQTKTVKGIHFIDGIYVDLNVEQDWAVVKHPQRVVSYTPDFEKKHETSLFMGNIFFDDKTSSWIGWSEGKDGGPEVKPKWTTIAHRGMSDQVTSLDDRYPEQMTPSTIEVPTENDWNKTSHDYLPQGNHNLPAEIKDKTGGFIQTVVKKNTAATGAPSDEIRSQICRPDDGSGGVWQRSYKFNDKVWNPWVKTSFTSQDLEAHKTDPNAHSNIFRYYRSYALFGLMRDIFSQITGDAFGGLQKDNSMLLADNHGYTGLDPLDYLDAPYTGKFNISGVLNFSGYSEVKDVKVTEGRWQVLLRKRTSKTAKEYTMIGSFTYQHVNKKTSGWERKKGTPYPSLLFDIKDVELESHQEVVMNITFLPDGSDKNELITKHPNLYLVPCRANVAIEDHKTRAGSDIARAYRTLYGNLDTLFDVGVKAHHSDPTDPTAGIRVYGERVNKKATLMQFNP